MKAVKEMEKAPEDIYYNYEYGNLGKEINKTILKMSMVLIICQE